MGVDIPTLILVKPVPGSDGGAFQSETSSGMQQGAMGSSYSWLLIPSSHEHTHALPAYTISLLFLKAGMLINNQTEKHFFSLSKGIDFFLSSTVKPWGPF